MADSSHHLPGAAPLIDALGAETAAPLSQRGSSPTRIRGGARPSSCARSSFSAVKVATAAHARRRHPSVAAFGRASTLSPFTPTAATASQAVLLTP
jgi:hypothetical protein